MHPTILLLAATIGVCMGAPTSVIKLRNENTCIDVSDATDQNGVKTLPCNATKTAQQFTFDSRPPNFIIHDTNNACLEDFWGSYITVWSNCPWSGGDSEGKQVKVLRLPQHTHDADLKLAQTP